MNIPSHHQSPFFQALEKRKDVDLKVIYLNGGSNERAIEGWCDNHNYHSFEHNAYGLSLISSVDVLLPDWTARIHLISSNFASDLIDFFCQKGVPWCHWSEMPGIRLAELLGYRVSLFRLLNPLMLLCKRGEGRRIRKYALGAFVQGRLARKAFSLMGVQNSKIVDLFYAPESLKPMVACEQIVKFAAGRRVFLSVGALCQRKGVDDLLKAYSRLNTAEWCLVLCGVDKLDGQYKALSDKLGILDRVLFLGAYPSDRIDEVYAAADVFVLASHFDGWGAVLNEAASVGLPLIATNMCGAAWHIIENGKNGFRVKAGSVIDLAEKMRIYLESHHFIKEHGRCSQNLFFQEFTPDRNAERLVTALNGWMLQ
ncbi:MAG: glycosyltransferase [Desulfuromonadaceae bacterium]|nr:glycosyltransferase [Desulfuromonadaceae bacterium]